MIKKFSFIILIIFIFIPVALLAGIKLYLLPEVVSKKNLFLSDIARFERLSEEAERAGGLLLDENLRHDGFIDKNEIITLLKNTGCDSFLVYGHSVKIIKQAVGRDKDIPVHKIFAVKAGEEVILCIQKRSITLSLRATALADGAEGEIIPVKLRSGKKIMAMVKGTGRLIKNI